MKHENRGHAELAPSGGDRWAIGCPGSIWRSLGLPELRPTPSSIEGTVFHEHAEQFANCAKKSDKNAYAQMLLSLELKNPEMAFWADRYVEYIERLSKSFANDQFHEFEEFLEQRVKLTENVWGTLDYGLARRKRKGAWEAIVSDIKYGKGKEVDAHQNIQTIIYLLCLEHHMGVKFKRAWIYIWQPRIEKDDGKDYTRYYLSPKELEYWRKFLDTAEKRALAMKRGEIPPVLKAGDHCQFCKARAVCEVRKEYIKGESMLLLNGADKLPDISPKQLKQLVAIHAKKKEIERYLADIDHFLIGRYLQGLPIGDSKVVRAGARSSWVGDHISIAKKIKALGHDPYTKKLITISKAKKILGEKQIKVLTTKGEGKLQLVPIDDPRSAVDTGKSSLDLVDKIS